MSAFDFTSRAIQNSREDVWFLKDIVFRGEPTKVITQNFNGPCSFIAICNILILRRDIHILPPERTSVSYEFLSQLVGEYLLMTSPHVDVSAALSMMPLTQKGMDLNPLFTSAKAFRPAGDAGALKLFEQAKIELVHGWLVDPSTHEHHAIEGVQDYDSAVNAIVFADDLVKGQLVVEADASASSSSTAGPSSSANVNGHHTDEDKQKIEDALLIRHFLDTTSSQLTYYGLFNLASLLEPGALVALFRNSHLAVLYKPEGSDGALYTLVTDHVFRHEASVVWERMEDVDGGSSTFVDADFKRSTPAGGDVAGHTAESALAAFEAEMGQGGDVDPFDQALARQLQAEEDEQASKAYAKWQQERAARRAEAQMAQGRARGVEEYRASASGMKKKKSCIIM